MQYPIEYKTIPVQFSFLISKDGTLKMQPVQQVIQEKKFKNEKEAREYIKNLKEII
jgi:hypothetical protein